MDHLSAADRAAIMDLIAAVAGAGDHHEFVELTLRGLLELIPAIDASYNELDSLARRAHYEVIPAPPGDLLEEARPLIERYWHQNPLVAHIEATGDTRTLMWSDFVTMEQMRATDIHREFFQQLGIDSQMAVTLPAPPGVIVGLVLNRGPEGFDERDRAVMNTLRPHLSHAYRSVRLVAELSALRAALGATGWTAALVADDGEVIEVTVGGAEALQELDIEVTEGRALPAPIRERFVPSVARYRATQPAVLSDPIRLSDEVGGVAGWYVPSPVPPHVVVFRGAVDVDTGRLAATGLTAREIEVAVALVAGGTNSQLALRLGMAEGTLRKHLSRIYDRLQVDNRTSAAAAIRDLLQPG